MSACLISSSRRSSIAARFSGFPNSPSGPQTRESTSSEPIQDQATQVIFCGTQAGSAKPAATVSTSKSRMRRVLGSGSFDSRESVLGFKDTLEGFDSIGAEGAIRRQGSDNGSID